MNRLIDNLAQSQSHGDAAEDIGVHVAEAPTAHEKVNHAVGRGPCGVRHVGSGFYLHPGIRAAVCRGHITGFDNRSGEGLLPVQMKPQRDVQRTLDPVDADLTVPLAAWPSPQLKSAPGL